ncbi:MAG: hypothetical protein RLZZ491_961 [Pseudomonadota bacterium]
MPVAPNATMEIVSFDALDGWAADDHAAALSVFAVTANQLDGPDWHEARSGLSVAHRHPRGYFERFFCPVWIDAATPALFTGYYEPEVSGARDPSAQFSHPVYRTPPEAQPGPWVSRREIEEKQLLQGRGLEIAWLQDAMDLFFLQVQGSGRIRLSEGGSIRVGYDGRNGHPYHSIGQELIRRGLFEPHQMSAQAIRDWVRSHPVDGRELLFHNPSYIFFREIELSDAAAGPLGAMNCSVTPMRSIAVDPAHTPLGAPVWIEKGGAFPLHRLMIAQDTGGAIKGAQRADIFFGSGDAAGLAAGGVRDRGRMIVLLPRAMAQRCAIGKGV